MRFFRKQLDILRVINVSSAIRETDIFNYYLPYKSCYQKGMFEGTFNIAENVSQRSDLF